MPATSTSPPRERILEAATRLLADHGRDAVTTRAVCAEAGVQAQTIYRHFGDMTGLLERAVAAGFTRFLATKKGRAASSDPVADLRQGWDLNLEFARSNPGIYALMYGQYRVPTTPETDQVYALLHASVSRAAAAGRLVVPVDVAATSIYAAGVGVALTVIANRGNDSIDSHILSDRTREAVIGAATVADGHSPGYESLRSHAVALAAGLRNRSSQLSPGEFTLLQELLRRISLSDDH